MGEALPSRIAQCEKYGDQSAVTGQTLRIPPPMIIHCFPRIGST